MTMTGLIDIFSSHALLGWFAVGAVLLIAELLTGSGWLLWPAGSAAVVALMTLVTPLDLTGQAAGFALVTIATTYLGRRLVNRAARHHGHDPNDLGPSLIGRSGNVVGAFEGGRGRVFVDGKEWSAELEGEATVPAGARIEVVALVGGARLKVRAG